MRVCTPSEQDFFQGAIIQDIHQKSITKKTTMDLKSIKYQQQPSHKDKLTHRYKHCAD